MDFSLPPDIAETRDSVRQFVHEHILPVEADFGARDAHENIAEEPLARLRQSEGCRPLGTRDATGAR